MLTSSVNTNLANIPKAIKTSGKTIRNFPMKQNYLNNILAILARKGNKLFQAFGGLSGNIRIYVFILVP
jgi:hypothetical protein